MATGKKSFLLYCDLLSTFEELTDEEAGRLIKHVLRYVNDMNPEAPDRLTKITFEPIKQALKRDLVKYEEIRQKKRLAGIASAESRKQNLQVLTGVDKRQHKATDSTVNDSVIDSVIVKEEKKINFKNKIDIPKNPETDYEKLLVWMEKNTPTVLKLEKQLTQEQFDNLLKTHGKQLIADTLLSMENKKDLLKKYKSVGLTLNNWMKPK